MGVSVEDERSSFSNFQGVSCLSRTGDWKKAQMLEIRQWWRI